MSMPVETITDEKTLAEAGFYWRGHEGIRVLVCRPLEEAGFANGFSTRLGGVSQFPLNDLNLAGFDEDTAENIFENRRRFLDVFKGEFELATAWQVHGEGVKVVRTQADVGNGEEKFDALVSDLKAVLVGVKTADCVPILLGDPVTGAFAAVHSGWKGTAKSIVLRAFERLNSEYGAKPETIIAAVGPAACGKDYEVGQEVIDAFIDESEDNHAYFTRTRPGHALVDLFAANIEKLRAAGLSDANIYAAPFCTMERTDLFFSYRKEKRKNGRTGRLLSVIGRSEQGR